MLTSLTVSVIGNTFFTQKQIQKMTWVSPGGTLHNELDHICVTSRWCASLLDVRSYRGARVSSDYFHVVGKIMLKVTKIQPKRPYTVDKPRMTSVSKSYHEELMKRLAVIQHPPTTEEQWSLFHRTISETAEAVVGRRRGTNKERWITDKTCK